MTLIRHSAAKSATAALLMNCCCLHQHFCCCDLLVLPCHSQGVINLAPSSASAQLATLWNASRAMPPISRHPSPMAHSAVQVPKTRCFLGTFKHPFARVQVHRTMFSARLQEERSSTSKLHLADRYCPAPIQVAATHHRQALS